MGDGVSGPLAEAYIEIRARGERVKDDVRDIAEKAAKEGGDKGGKTFADKFAESSSKQMNQGGTKAKLTAALEGGGSGGGSFWESKGRQAGAKFGSKLGAGVLTALKGIGTLAVGASALGSIGTLIGGTVSAVTELAGTLLLLPAIVFGVGAAFATLKLGTSGLMAAFEAKGSGDPAKFAAALSALGTNAQAVFSAIDHLAPAFGRLKSGIEQTLFTDLGNVLDRLGTKYLPSLEYGLTGIAKGFNLAARGVGGFLGQADSIQMVTRILDDTGAAALNLSDTMPHVVAAFLTLADVGSDYLPGGADAINAAAEKFDEFIQRLASTGKLDEIIETGIAAVGNLVDVLKEAGRIVGGIFGAAADVQGGALGSLANLLGEIADQIARPEFQRGLSEVFGALSESSDELGGVLPAVADALIALAPAFANLINGAAGSFADVLQDVASVVTVLAPLLNVLTGALASIGPFAGPLIILLGLVSGAFKAVEIAASLQEGIASFKEGLTELTGSAEHADKATRRLAKGAALLGLYTVVMGAIGAVAPKIEDSAASVGKLAEAVDKFTRGADTGNISSLGKNFDNLGAQLYALANPNAMQRVDDFTGSLFNLISFGNLGSSKGGDARRLFLTDLETLDAQLTGLVQGGKADEAAAAFQKINTTAIDGGAGVQQLAGHLPGYTDAVAAASAASNGAVTSVSDLAEGFVDQSGATSGATNEMRELTAATLGYATAVLSARGDVRGFEAAIDDAVKAAKDNGKTLDEGTEKGRANATALDAIASAGIKLAQTTKDNGGSEKDFQKVLADTRSELVKAGRRFGLTADEARTYARTVIGIPKTSTLHVTTPGMAAAIARAGRLIAQANTVNGRTYSYTIRQIFESVGKQDDAMANRGNNARAAGGAVLKGRTYLVGEEGPEYLTAGVTGYISSAGITATAAKGMADLENTQPQRMAVTSTGQTTTAQAPSRLDRDDLDYLLRGLAKVMREQPVVLDSGVVAGAVYREGGRF